VTELRWGERTYVMGIVNVTPDSFSGDGIAGAGRSAAEIVAAAVEQARGFVDAGAQLLDVGGESSRPAQFYGEHPLVSAEEEAARAIPVMAALAAELGDRAMLSIDTIKGSVARDALAAGATMVNDVWSGQRDAGTLTAAGAKDVHLVLMHNKELAEYPNGVFDEVVSWLRARVDDALAAGVRRERLVVDPGIGFGKTPAHSIEMLHRLAEFKEAMGGLPLLVGTSRKRVIGELLGGAPPDQRLEGTAASVALAIGAGADIVRVHDVEAMMKTVRVSDGIVRWRP
jgi:dihydropteroate synthase